MVEVNDTELTFSFPEVHEEAVLRMYFRSANSPEQRVNIQQSRDGAIRLATEGQFVMYLLPGRDCLAHRVWYPFALILSVGGKNAITGEISTTLSRSPQNYFTTPPQGGIDGYFQGTRVHPFRAVSEAIPGETRLEIRAFPLKSKEFAYFNHQLQLIPGPGPSPLRGITLQHGGERQCEPIYEDICSIGSWDKDHEDRAWIWVVGT